MVAMQTFYTDLSFAAENMGSAFSGLWRIARASLKEILAVRSELAWDAWAESK
ncbi:MAG: hypothetical protein WD751_05470 [Anaerolineales bacterium]